MIRVSIAGASGYSGGELLGLLLRHPQVELVALTAGEQQGRDIAEVFPNVRGLLSQQLVAPDWKDLGCESDVVFLALPHGMAMDAAPELLAAGARVIDLGADFRLRDPELYERWYGIAHRQPELLEEAVYGLTERTREAIRGAHLVANPGCYPTAAALALLPLLPLFDGTRRAIVDAKSGVSGAGRRASNAFFGEVNETVRPYNVGAHRHVPEMEQTFSDAGFPAAVFFSPHLVPMTRGILATCYLSGPELPSLEKATAALADAYREEPFVRVLEESLPETKATFGSNYTDIALRLDRERGVLAVISALDNLGKGAAGQAIQNMNLMFGLDERTGIDRAPLYP